VLQLFYLFQKVASHKKKKRIFFPCPKKKKRQFHELDQHLLVKDQPFLVLIFKTFLKMSQKKPTSAAKKSKISKTVENVTAEIAPSESETNRKDSVANNNENAVKISKGQRKLNGNAAVTDVSKNTRTNSSKGSSLYQTKALAGVLSRFPVVFTKDSK
jgi:hypothetical protein